MSRQTILIIRHAEKSVDAVDGGVDSSGSPDPRSLTPRGWQRAGAWTALLVPALDRSAPGAQPILPRPTAIFASALAKRPDGGGRSRRPLETVIPLAARLGLEIDQSFTKGMESALAAAISTIDGVVLVSWQHEHIATIARALAPGATNIPGGWQTDRFNVLFRLDRDGPQFDWTFEQISPVMLAGDSPDPL
jgi:broad specificity phosphatase PhoE